MNDMKRYLLANRKTPEKVRALAVACGVSRIYLTQIGAGHGKASGVLARKLDDETNGEIRRSSLREDIFGPVDA